MGRTKSGLDYPTKSSPSGLSKPETPGHTAPAAEVPDCEYEFLDTMGAAGPSGVKAETAKSGLPRSK